MRKLSALVIATVLVTAPVVALAQGSSLTKSHETALNLALKGKTDQAIEMLKKLEKTPLVKTGNESNQNEKDQVELSLGRLYYEKGSWAQAMTAYQKVERGGPNWLEAIHEEAWVDFRADRPQESIAKLQTVTLPLFQDRVGSSEPFFLLALAELRTCSYRQLFKTLDTFKTRYRDRVKSLEATKTAANQSQLEEISDTIQKLNLVEAEAIQRLYLDENGKRRSGSVAGIERGDDQLSFPETEGDEVWIDELEGYQVKLKGCAVPAPAVKVARKGDSK